MPQAWGVPRDLPKPLNVLESAVQVLSEIGTQCSACIAPWYRSRTDPTRTFIVHRDLSDCLRPCLVD